VSAASRMDELAGVHVPTCVVHGTEDPLFPYEHAQVMARTIPAAVLVPWKRVGHELPAPLVPDLTEVILRQVRAGA
jgi:pimeloyl-ACP methyl ester carboxylesterase